MSKLKTMIISIGIISTSFGYAQECQRVVIIDTANSTSTFLIGDKYSNKAQGKAVYYAFKDGWKMSEKIAPSATSSGKIMIVMEKETSGDCDIIDPFMN
ncbi:hypothetical protein HBM95_23420 [Enterobacter asburiae]|nr:hypothetical protein [Enterobacter asburiae]